jgi:aminoglycoside phosphotransferase (APT) family kinase protein
VLLARAVAGRPAAGLVAARPDLVPGLLDRLAAWLESWGTATRVGDGFGAAEVEARLLEPALALDPHVPDGAAYREWLRELCAHLPGTVPAVAAHNDLTTGNVLAAPGGHLAVVDWESARERDLPLRDLVYATVDALFVAGRFASRAAAFDACYAGRGEEAQAARRQLERLSRALGLDPAAALACFHACWLEHAVNDVRRVPAAESEFVAIVLALVRGREGLAALLGR